MGYNVASIKVDGFYAWKIVKILVLFHEYFLEKEKMYFVKSVIRFMNYMFKI